MGAGAAKENRSARDQRSNSLRAEAERQRFLSASGIQKTTERKSVAELNRIPSIVLKNDKAQRADSLGEGGQVVDWEYNISSQIKAKKQKSKGYPKPKNDAASLPVLRRTMPEMKRVKQQQQHTRHGGSMVVKKNRWEGAGGGSGSYSQYQYGSINSFSRITTVRAPLVELSRFVIYMYRDLQHQY